VRASLPVPICFPPAPEQPATTGEKTCTRCAKTLPNSAFYRANSAGVACNPAAAFARA
jgi:hypothetical protein